MEDLKNNDETNIAHNQILEYSESQDTENNNTEEQEIISTEETNLETASVISNNEAEVIETENASTTNCLALTIKEEHKLVAVKNVFLHSLKVSWKVIASTIALHILKIFF